MKNRRRNGHEETDIFVSVETVHVHTMINRGIETEMLQDHVTWNELLDLEIAMLHDREITNEYPARYRETVHDHEISISLGGDNGNTALIHRLTVPTHVITHQHRTMTMTHVSRRTHTLTTTDHNNVHHQDWVHVHLRLR